ncbi:hypothetical protein K501DRAFT_231270 [Backusella circina FSU 941]|nr:hypothetical protein K501DRAFT_231270 [Backusella circina FSU 941]
MQPTSSKDFKIHLEEDNLILRGSTDESAGVMLRGSIILNCYEQTKVKTIALKLTGKANVHWTEGRSSHQKHNKAERVIISKELVFLPLKKKSHHLFQGQYKWDFEFPLPGNLPQSLDHEMGQVSYRLRAICERPTFSANYIDKKDVTITRLMLPTSLELTQQVVISNVWADKIMYNISIPSKVFSIGKVVPISFSLTPIAPNLKILAIFCALKEYTTCSTLDSHITNGKVISDIKDEHIVVDGATGETSKTELMHIPADPRHVRFDTSSELITVKHKIKFTVSLQNEDGHISELRAAIPVVIAPILLEEDLNALPSYEETWRSIPYDPYAQEQMVSMDDHRSERPSRSSSCDSYSSISTSSTLSTTSSSFDEDRLEPVPWMGMDICRVPSYSTAVRTANIPCHIAPSLPSYESITIL